MRVLILQFILGCVIVEGFQDEITFHLYTGDKDDRVIYEGDVLSLKSSSFNRRKPTKIIVHGWTDSKDVPWIKEMKEVMAVKNRWNVIVVDWAPLSHTRFTEAVEHSNLVATKLSNFTNFLLKCERISPASVHYIGHGLGVSVVGLAARTLRKATVKSIRRITGLDPSSWPSRFRNPSEILSRSDATFVDVIHTNGNGFGTMDLLGHVDYFPNGGKRQPGCGSCTFLATNKFCTALPAAQKRARLRITATSVGLEAPTPAAIWSPNLNARWLWSAFAVMRRRVLLCTAAMCSHIRACEYWTASVRNIFAFKAYNYDLWERHLHNHLNLLPYFPMGIAANPTIPAGVYFVETSDRPPHVYKKHKFI